MSRREKIEAMLAEDPGDTFLRYSLAMELRSEGKTQESLSLLDALMADTPPCVSAFFMAAQQLVDLDEVDAARERLRVGIDQARAQGDSHAAAEMSDYLAGLGSAELLGGVGTERETIDAVKLTHFHREKFFWQRFKRLPSCCEPSSSAKPA